MKAGSFILNGIDSETLKTVIQSRPVLEAPRRRVTFKKAYGGDGDIPYDEEAYDNTPLSLYCYTNGDSATIYRELVFHMLDSGGYQDLILYNDPTKIYRVMVTEPPKFENRYYDGEGFAYEIGFTVKPYKKLVESSLITLTGARAVNNPSRWSSLPIIKITGSGDITLFVNDLPFVVKNITGHITLDSLAQIASKQSGDIIEPQNINTYTKKFPILKPGLNTIRWTGTVSKVEIQPEWRTLV